MDSIRPKGNAAMMEMKKINRAQLGRMYSPPKRKTQEPRMAKKFNHSEMRVNFSET
jgi:hypothetical protein